jgi:hypothetical protein
MPAGDQKRPGAVDARLAVDLLVVVGNLGKGLEDTVEFD